MPALESPMSRPLIHIGYHKTGTNWLQKQLFRRKDFDFRFVSLSRSDFVSVNDFDFDPEKYRQEFLPLFSSCARDTSAPMSVEVSKGSPTFMLRVRSTNRSTKVS